MPKTRQPELLLQPKLIHSLTIQGFLAFKSSDRFKAGRPDLRVARKNLGQIDFELKYVESGFQKEEETGLRLLQRIKMLEMNEHGMPAIGLIYCAPIRMFFVTLLLRSALPLRDLCVLRGDTDDTTIDGHRLFSITRNYLRDHGF